MLARSASSRAHVGDPETPARAPSSADPGTPGPPEPPPDPAAPGPIPLLPRVPIARAAGWILPPEPLPSDREEIAEADLERFFDDALLRDRLEAGDVDGWYHETGRAMRRAFRPDRDAIEGERRAGMTVLQRLYDELRRYAGGPERPQDGAGHLLPEQRSRLTTDPTDRRQAVGQEVWDICNPLNAPTTWYRADVRVTHNPEGELSAAWILRSSGIRALDEAALAAARSGSMDLRAPPPNVVGERQAIRSDWAFEMGDVATPLFCMTPEGSPVLNGLSCVEDPVHDEWQCAVFGRGIIRTRVRLLAVVDATHETPEERRARRRRDPAMPRP